MSNGLDPDQDRQNVGPDLGQNCLQSLSVRKELFPKNEESDHNIFHFSYSLDRDFEGKQWEALSNAGVDLLSSI